MKPQRDISSLRATIKRATQSIHDRLDSDPAALKLMAVNATRDDYVQFLIRTYGFQKPIEDQLFSERVNDFMDPIWPEREPRAPAILADLDALDVSSVDAWPLMPRVPAIHSVGHAMGVSYVLEGSMMGGLVMAKPVARNVGVSTEALNFFLPTSPREIVRQFERFAEALDGFARCQCDEVDAIDAATETFQLIADWFRTAPKPNYVIEPTQS